MLRFTLCKVRPPAWCGLWPECASSCRYTHRKAAGKRHPSQAGLQAPVTPLRAGVAAGCAPQGPLATPQLHPQLSVPRSTQTYPRTAILQATLHQYRSPPSCLITLLARHQQKRVSQRLPRRSATTPPSLQPTRTARTRRFLSSSSPLRSVLRMTPPGLTPAGSSIQSCIPACRIAACRPRTQAGALLAIPPTCSHSVLFRPSVACFLVFHTEPHAAASCCIDPGSCYTVTFMLEAEEQSLWHRAAALDANLFLVDVQPKGIRKGVW